MENMCLDKIGDISTLNGDSLKLVNKFTYLGSSESSTENDITMRLIKAYTAIDRLSIKWKSNLSDKIKSSDRVHNTIWVHHIDDTKAYRERTKRELHENGTSHIDKS